MKQLTKYHKKSFYTFMIFNILVPLTNIAFAYSIKIIIDSGMSQNREALTQAILIGAIVIFIYASLNFISLRLRNKLVRQIMSRYKNKVFKSILDSDYREFSKECGVTIFISSHILSEISQIADKIGFIKNGEMVEQVSMKEIRRENIDLEEYFMSHFLNEI